jgi:hypothetical protein
LQPDSRRLLAAASDAIVVGFHVGILPKAREIAKREQVDVRTYNIIYEVTKDIQAAMEGLLGPVMEEKTMKRVARFRQAVVLAVGLFAVVTLVPGPSVAQQKVQVEFWHGLTQPLGGILEAVAAGFNASQDKYQVNATFKEKRGRDVFLTGGEYRTRPIATSLFCWGIWQSRDQGAARQIRR